MNLILRFIQISAAFLWTLHIASCLIPKETTDTYLSGPGLGWDFLVDASRSSVQSTNTFTANKHTNDGLYRIGDCLEADTVKTSHYLDTSEIIATSQMYQSMTSKSVKLSASISIGVVTIGGSYSKDYFAMLKEQKNTSTVTTRSKIIDHKYNLYSSLLCPPGREFTMVATDLLTAIKYGYEDDAKYFSQELIADYGTHYIKRVKLGGIMYTDNYVAESYWEKMKTKKEVVQASASVTFQNMIGLNFGVGQGLDTQEFNAYYENIKTSHTSAVGGEYTPGMNISRWTETLKNNLIPIDREAELISSLFLSRNFPGFTSAIIRNASLLVDDAVKTYLQSNTLKGCTDPGSINFEPYANLQEKSACDEQIKFGGIISAQATCSETNIITNANACPVGYTQKTSFAHTGPVHGLTECVGDSPYVVYGQVLFGGIFSTLFDNPVTKDKSCPPLFVRQSLFDCANNVICVSTETNNLIAIKYAVPFGGIFSSCNTTPLQTECPVGMETNLISVKDGCQIFYCAKFKNFSEPKLKKLPFVAKPPHYNLIKALNAHRK